MWSVSQGGCRDRDVGVELSTDSDSLWRHCRDSKGERGGGGGGGRAGRGKGDGG